MSISPPSTVIRQGHSILLCRANGLTWLGSRVERPWRWVRICMNIWNPRMALRVRSSVAGSDVLLESWRRLHTGLPAASSAIHGATVGTVPINVRLAMKASQLPVSATSIIQTYICARKFSPVTCVRISAQALPTWRGTKMTSTARRDFSASSATKTARGDCFLAGQI